MTTKPLRIALTKGRLEKDTVALMERVGLDCHCLLYTSVSGHRVQMNGKSDGRFLQPEIV